MRCTSEREPACGNGHEVNDLCDTQAVTNHARVVVRNHYLTGNTKRISLWDRGLHLNMTVAYEGGRAISMGLSREQVKAIRTRLDDWLEAVD